MLAKRRRRKPKAGEAIYTEHFLVPKHELVKDDEVEKILSKLGASREQLPRIKQYDPAIANLNAKEGDIIKIHRDGEAVYYRIVVRE